MRIPMPSRLSPCLMAAFVLAQLLGCSAVGPEHKVPEVPLGQGWLSNADSRTETAALARWWKTLGDPELERLVELALARNLDLRQAEQNIEASRAMLSRAEALSSPTLKASGSTQRSRTSLNGPEYNPLRSPNQTVSDAGLDASWEIDLFGSLRRQRESAEAALQMSEAEAKGLRLAIEAEAARTYLLVRGAQRELAARQASVEALSRILELVRRRQQAGDLPSSEVERAQARLDQARAALPAIEARRQAAVIALGLLTGGLPESQIALADTQGPEIELGAIPVGQRAELLSRRPDVIAAERKLASATADTGTATAELFPKLTLSASAGFRALGGKDLFEGDSQRGSIGPLIAWRILDGGRVRAEIRASEARQQAAAIGYEKAVLGALADAEKALDQYGHTLASLAAQEKALASTGRSTEILRQRHKLGDTSLAELLDAEREFSDQQAAFAQLKTSAASDLVALYKALGGGWEAPQKP